MNLSEAIALLQAGEPILFPTETVFGLGAPLFNPSAVARVFAIKGRPAHNPLIAHVSSIEQVEEIAEEIPEIFYRLAKQFWPGPLTFVLRKKAHVPSIVTAGGPTIAVRCPSHPLARELIAGLGQPIVGTSANLSGQPSPVSKEQALAQLGDIPCLDGLPAPLGIASTIISLPLKLLRRGAIPYEKIEEFLNGGYN